MELKFDVIKNQRFEIGRTINPFLCNCGQCDFLHCPKKNYAVKVRQHIFKVEEFIEAFIKDIDEQKVLTIELINEFMECFRFPKGTYWDTDEYGSKIRLVSFNRKGHEICKGSVDVKTGEVWDYDFTTAQEALAKRISKGILKVNKFIQTQ